MESNRGVESSYSKNSPIPSRMLLHADSRNSVMSSVPQNSFISQNWLHRGVPSLGQPAENPGKSSPTRTVQHPDKYPPPILNCISCRPVDHRVAQPGTSNVSGCPSHVSKCSNGCFRTSEMLSHRPSRQKLDGPAT